MLPSRAADTRHPGIWTERSMAFLQESPQLSHPYRSDRSLLAVIDRALPVERRAALDADLAALGDYAPLA